MDYCERAAAQRCAPHRLPVVRDPVTISGMFRRLHHRLAVVRNPAALFQSMSGLRLRPPKSFGGQDNLRIPAEVCSRYFCCGTSRTKKTLLDNVIEQKTSSLLIVTSNLSRSTLSAKAFPRNVAHHQTLLENVRHQSLLDNVVQQVTTSSQSPALSPRLSPIPYHIQIVYI